MNLAWVLGDLGFMTWFMNFKGKPYSNSATESDFDL